jgi:hypothetical protein
MNLWFLHVALFCHFSMQVRMSHSYGEVILCYIFTKLKNIYVLTLKRERFTKFEEMSTLIHINNNSQ